MSTVSGPPWITPRSHSLLVWRGEGAFFKTHQDTHQQKCKNVVQDRVNFDTGALLRGRAIDARCIGLHRPRENSLEWGARIARHRDRRGCTAMHPNSVAPNWDALQCGAANCNALQGTAIAHWSLEGRLLRRVSVFVQSRYSHMIVSPSHLRTQRLTSLRALVHTLDVIHHLVHQSIPFPLSFPLQHHLSFTQPPFQATMQTYIASKCPLDI